ncbi:MAG: FGGY family carbohydrate kinase [Actinobacteria bacterium]|nr:FGGY family carbohydrate kinase [Actinomycetota bacterium]
MSYLGIDIGQSGCKGQVYNNEGKLIASSKKNYCYELASGSVELNPQKIWKNLQSLVLDIVSQTKNDPVKMICFSFLGSAIMALDDRNEPLTNFIIIGNNDICDYFNSKINYFKSFKSLYLINGIPLKAGYPLSKAIWLYSKSSFKNKIKRFMMVEDFILLKLGIAPELDYSLASLTGLFDINKKEWSEEASEIFNLDLSYFSKPGRTGSLVGVLPDSICSELSLKKGVKILLGGFDQYMSALGSGAIMNNSSSNSMGSADCITNIFNKISKLDYFEKFNYQIGTYLIDDLYATLCYVNSGGSLLEYYKSNFYTKEAGLEKDFYFNLESGIKNIRNKIFVLPHFIGSGTPWLDDYSRGMIVGLKINDTREDIFVSILESICFELKINLDIIEKNLGNIKELMVLGGGAKSDLWLKIRSNIFQIPVKRVRNKEGGCLAGALFSMVEDKQFKNIYDAVHDSVEIEKIFYPEKELEDYYIEKYNIYKKIYVKNKDILNEISKTNY